MTPWVGSFFSYSGYTRFMQHTIFAIVGPSGSGKTTLINQALERLPEILRIIKTYTTRAPRAGETDRQHVFISREEADLLVRDHDVVESDEYAGNFYGTPKSYLDSLLKTHHGIKAITENGALAMRALGYPLCVIRVTPRNNTGGTDVSRITTDAAREKIPLAVDLTIENDFAPGGEEHAVQQLVEYISSTK